MSTDGAKQGFQVIADSPPAQDKKFAARPSPYTRMAHLEPMSTPSKTADIYSAPAMLYTPPQPVQNPIAKTSIPLPVLAQAAPLPAVKKVAPEKPATVLAFDSDVPAPVLVSLPPEKDDASVAVAKAKPQKAQPVMVKTEPQPHRARVAMVTLKSAKKPAVALASDADVPAPKLVVQDVVETPVNVSPPPTQSAVNAAQVLADSAVRRAGAQSRAVIVAQSELASLVVTSQQSAANFGSVVAAQAAATQLALNDAKSLSALAPAAGPVPGGDSTPVQTMPVAAQPAALQPEAASQPAEIMDLPPIANTPPMPPAFVPAPPAELSNQSKAIVSKLPPEKQKKMHTTPVSVEHFQKNPLENEDVRKHEGIGISISVRRPKPNISHMLEQAYDALIAGNQEEAITTYKDVLKEEPENKLALFGLATTYHRAGQLNLARPLYGKLLAIDPNNAEGLNNFLVLLGDEAPGEALSEMKKLEHTHPDFSPLPAQMAVIYEKMGEYENAINSMKHAIELSPENIKYRYDMGVMMDKAGDWEDAAVFYQQLITAADRGEKIPAREEEIQERLTFIRSNKPRL